MMKEIEEE